MDNINFCRKFYDLRGFEPGLALISAAFVLGAALFALLGETVMNNVMYIRRTAEIAAWLGLTLLLTAGVACLITPVARLFCALYSAFCGATAAFISYVYADLKPFSAEFFAFSAVVFVFSAAIAYVFSYVFNMSFRLRAFVRADRKLRRELDIFSVASLLFTVAALIAAAVFILRF